MKFKYGVLWLCILCFVLPFAAIAFAENYPVIITGKVMLPDGSPPPFKVGIERYCSDGFGSAPGPLTDKDGGFLWRMDVDPMRTRACVIRATHAGYSSTSIDISALNGYLSTTKTLDPIIISSPAEDPYMISLSDSSMPMRSRSELKAAMKALDNRDYAETVNQLKKAMSESPKFAPGWHALGVVLDHQNAIQESREAYEKAIQSDARFLPAYITLIHTCSKLKDWRCVVQTADALAKAEKKKTFAEVSFHRAVAHYYLNEFEPAASSVQEAIRMDPLRRIPRTEYVYGRILEAKGDINGAREHMMRYLETDKNAPDPEKIKLHIENLGKPQGSGSEPELDFP